MEDICLTDRFSEKDKFEKCPICLTITQTFVELGTKRGCLSCGCVFMPMAMRNDIKSRQKEILDAQKALFRCKVCRKPFDKRIALVGHMRGKCGQVAG